MQQEDSTAIFKPDGRISQGVLGGLPLFQSDHQKDRAVPWHGCGGQLSGQAQGQGRGTVLLPRAGKFWLQLNVYAHIEPLRIHSDTKSSL